MSLSRPVWIGFAVGTCVGAPSFIISFLTAFSICSDTSIAEGLVPFALITDPSLFDRPLIALVLALIQYPLYGIILGIAWAQANVRKLVFIVCVIVVVVSHVVAINFANHRVKAMWEAKFSHMNY